MAHDTSDTRNRTIITGAIVTVLFLVAVKFILNSYFIQITEATAKEKLATPELLIKQREAEKKALSSGPMPIDVAMAEIARGRDVARTGGQDITPRPSDDLSALTGWSKMPRTLVVAPVTEVNLLHPTASADPLAAGDAGVVDAGAMTDAAAADASAAKLDAGASIDASTVAHPDHH
jgi:hypothetical protein